MRRKSIAWTIAIVAFLTANTGGVLAWLLHHEPAFYARAALPASLHRSRCSGEFVGELARLIAGINDKRQWDGRFTAEQINSYCQEDLLKEHADEQPLPHRISEPRVALDPDRIRLGFRYGIGLWSTIVSIDVRVWLVAKEANVVALEFEGIHAGALSVSSQSLLERAAETARRYDIDPTWYRHHGHPVLLLRFQAGRSRPTFQIQKLDLHAGMVCIRGVSLDTTPQANLGTGGRQEPGD